MLSHDAMTFITYEKHFFRTLSAILSGKFTEKEGIYHCGTWALEVDMRSIDEGGTFEVRLTDLGMALLIAVN